MTIEEATTLAQHWLNRRLSCRDVVDVLDKKACWLEEDDG